MGRQNGDLNDGSRSKDVLECTKVDKPVNNYNQGTYGSGKGQKV